MTAAYSAPSSSSTTTVAAIALTNLSGDGLDQIMGRMVGRASSFEERAFAARESAMAPSDDGLGPMRLEAWCQIVAGGDRDAFRQRLARDELDFETVRDLLGREPAEHESLPPWACLVRAVLALLASAPRSGASDMLLDPLDPLPFEDALVPFVEVAQGRLAAEAGRGYGLLTESARTALNRGLLRTLTSLAAPTLFTEFVRFRRRYRTGPLYPDGMRAGAGDRPLYQAFVTTLLQGGLVEILAEYAVLARLLGTTICLTVEAHAEMLARLDTDQPLLDELFGGEAGLGPVVDLQPDLSDPHGGRRNVVGLRFASGRRLVYKPQNIRMLAAYNQLLVWLNAAGAPLPFQVLRVIDRETHGWVEWIDHLPCADEQQVRRYYLRAGMLLAVVYALDGTDCHYDNLIASGEHPVLIDTEMLLHERGAPGTPFEGAAAYYLAVDQVEQSVLTSRLLPAWILAPGGRLAFDPSGLGGTAPQETPHVTWTWQSINTDRMAVTRQRIVLCPTKNVVLLRGEPVDPSVYVGEVIAGFRALCSLLIERRAALLASGRLEQIASGQVRLTFRSTAQYVALLDELLAPGNLRHGVERSIGLDVLAAGGLPPDDTFPRWPILKAEQKALEQADIPCFNRQADGSIVSGGGERWPSLTNSAGAANLDRLIARLEQLDDDECERQVSLIEGAFYARQASILLSASSQLPVVADRPAESAAVAYVGRSAEPGGPRSSADLVAHAVSIAERIGSAAIQAGDGSVAWIGPDCLPGAGRVQFQPLRESLESGACGIALFLAAAVAAGANSDFRTLALGAVQPLRLGLRDCPQAVADQLGIGGPTGLGGVVYALTQMSQSLDDPHLLDDARRAAALLTAERLSADRRPNRSADVAGAALGLARLHRLLGDQATHDLIELCGQRLLAEQPSPASGRTAPPTEGEGVRTACAPSIALALFRIHAVTHDAVILQAARTYLDQEVNWMTPPLRDGAPTWTDWTDARAIASAVALIQAVPWLDETATPNGFAGLLDHLARPGLGAQDGLRGGALGRAEALLAASMRLGRPDMEMRARVLAAEAIQRGAPRGALSRHAARSHAVLDPGFMHGGAGVGYTLLRLAQPDRFPSALLWE